MMMGLAMMGPKAATYSHAHCVLLLTCLTLFSSSCFSGTCKAENTGGKHNCFQEHVPKGHRLALLHSMLLQLPLLLQLLLTLSVTAFRAFACSASSLSFLESSLISKASSSAMLPAAASAVVQLSRSARCSAVDQLEVTAVLRQNFNQYQARVAYSGHLHCGSGADVHGCCVLLAMDRGALGTSVPYPRKMFHRS
jgi:hypothetical protein